MRGGSEKSRLYLCVYAWEAQVEYDTSTDNPYLNIPITPSYLCLLCPWLVIPSRLRERRPLYHAGLSHYSVTPPRTAT